LLEQEEFRWVQPTNFERKLKRYECQMKKIKKISYEKSQGLSSRKPDLFYLLPKILKLL